MSEAAASGGLSNQLLNRLRAAVLGANDGIVSTASVVMGVAGATNEYMMIVTAGLAALVAGALSMAVGEYVSVSSQADAEKAYIAKQGQKPHDDINSPLQAAIFSFTAFVAGGAVPFVAVLLAPDAWRVMAIMAAVVVALVCTGYFSARAGKASARRATLRVVTGGVLAMVITYYVGVLFGVAVG